MHIIKNKSVRSLSSVWMTVLLLSLISCQKDWLDEKTDIKLTTPATLKDFQALLDNENNLNGGSPACGEMASDGHYMTDASFNSRTGIERNAYIWSNSPPTDGSVDWNNPYINIFTCNVVLDGLEKERGKLSIDLENFNNIKGQALFQRARSFYELAQIFAPPYTHSSMTSELGIPLRINSDANVKTTRSSLKQTYEQIIGDLMVAKDLLPLNALVKTRGSKIAVFALLARIYLSMEDYNLAKEYATNCLNNYSILLDYNSLDSTSTAPIPRLNTEVIFQSNLGVWNSLGAFLLIDPALKALYHSNDLRRVMFLGKGTGTNITFKGSYYGSTSIQFNGLATDEMYLIRAECNARIGNLNDALNDFNTLLKKRWKKTAPFPNFSFSDRDDGLKQILEERKKELLLRGLRWSDLRRLNYDEKFKVILSRTVSGMTYTLDPNSYKYTFPIGIRVLELTGIQQNSGW